MNFKISKKEFLDALSLSSRAISSTTPLPSLSGIKFTATENSLTLVSSDSNISIRTSINNNDKNALIINEPGEIVLEARYILEIARKIDTFETSILRYEDCCTVFTPKHPNTKPRKADVLEAQAQFDFSAMIEKAIENIRFEIIEGK